VAKEAKGCGPEKAKEGGGVKGHAYPPFLKGRKHEAVRK